MSSSALRASYPAYFMSKKKLDVDGNISLDKIFTTLEAKFGQYPINKVDGFKIDFETAWVHLRSSNTEPIIRIYSESESMAAANALANRIKGDINTFI